MLVYKRIVISHNTPKTSRSTYINTFIYILSILLHTDCPSCSTTFACKRILLRKLVEKAKVKTKPPEKPADDHRSVCPAEKISVTIGSENVFGKASESLKNQQIHPSRAGEEG